MSEFYVTTPIYYVNDLPHIGHVYTTVVADVVARWRRLNGDRVYFLTGTDEHGQNIERAAAERGIPPLQLADQVVSRYHDLWQEWTISHDDFIRTTEPRHAAGVEAIIHRLAAADDLYLSRHEGWYCPSCETFYTEKELLAGERCPIHERATEWRSEENVFFRLSKYQDALLAWYDRASPVQPETRANEVRNFVAAGLRDLSVSRTSLTWGIPFPGHPGHTVYVWLDALTNYISALGFGRGAAADEDLYRTFWQEAPVRLHLVGKDILRFHTVYWPAFLLSAGLPLPTAVWAHGWWLRDARKISKSVGNVVRPDHLVARFGSDSLRYFLLRDMAFGQDASFSDEAFIERYNSDLANDLGNTVSRLSTLARRAFAGRTPPPPTGGGLEGAATQAMVAYRRAMDGFAFHRALESLWKLLAETGQYLVTREPWKKLADPTAAGDVAEILGQAFEAVRLVASGLVPVMPVKAAEALHALGAAVPSSLDDLAWGARPAAGEVPPSGPIFPRIDKEAYLAEASTEKTPAAAAGGPPGGEKEARMITFEQFLTTELRVATVVAAVAVPKSKKLLQLTLDVGEESPRTVVAGIAQQYAPETLVGKQVVVVANLAPAKLMGIESNGMVLAASDENQAILLHPEKPVPNGTRVR